tara:strand:- start:10022 stop:10684 length:663 start_codon:yes stop_codon:yes gene_type:complete
MKPYFYKIRNKETGQYYVGSQYGKKSNPKNLLVEYFTSSKLVHKLGIENFEIIYIKERPDAREYESRYLKRVYKILGRDRFCEILLNRNTAPGILLDEDMINHANKKRKISSKLAALKRVYEGNHNFVGWDQPWTRTPEERKKRSERMLGNDYGKNRKITNELRQIWAEKSKGNQNVRGTIWVINKEGKRKRVSPNNIPDGFVKGTNYAEVKDNRRTTLF